MARRDVIRTEVDPNEFRDFMARIKEFDPSLARALRKRLRKVGQEIVKDMQAEIRSAPGGNTPGNHNVRQQIAAGLGVKISTAKKRQGVIITGSSAKLPRFKREMARAMNKKSFRHPVFPERGENTKHTMENR